MGLVEQYNLGFKKIPTFRSNGKIITPQGTGFVVAGEKSGANDCNMFPSLIRLSNGSFIISYSWRTGHGTQDENSSGYYKISLNKCETWQERVKKNSVEGWSGAGFDIAINDRMINYMYRTDGFTGARVPYTNFSDDLWQTFSEPVKISDAFDGNQRQADGTGGHCLLADGTIYKSFYGRTTSAGPRYAQVFKTLDNGETFAFVRNVAQPSSFDFEEAQIKQLPDGRLIMLLRTDTDRSVYVCYATSEMHWSDPAYAFDSWARPSFDVNPLTGTILCSGGKDLGNDERIPTYHYSNDFGKTWTSGFLSERLNFQTYGDVKWIEGNKWFMVWSEDTNFPNGPADIYGEFFYET